ncbi:21097_t:CDS:2 [Dentiscutata erythropus]|uniref:21097_t:CDS:1 n=1 Tax=Dentiscutata erythropus TaxID=1348616 RepID=A0A9N9F4F4_9GLOM|nr:21097_t:CDS:2 [Dentiscutata erythropus]
MASLLYFASMVEGLFCKDVSCISGVLLNDIFLNAQEAKDQFEHGFESEAFNRLEEISKTINLLKDFKSKYAELNIRQLTPSITTPQPQPAAAPVAVEPLLPNTVKSVKRTIQGKYEKPKKAIKTNVEDTPTITSEVYSVNVRELPTVPNVPNVTNVTNDPYTNQPPPPVYAPAGVLPNAPRTHTHAPLDPKMQKLDESPDFRPFKFRIQAFTNAFHEELLRHGYTEEILPLRKVKNYLWTQRYISRFNEDGKKAKSKGNHVWNIEAKKTPSGGWIFREFTRKIAGIPDKIAYVGVKYTYAPRVWDPQVNVKSIKAVFHSPWLPDWLRWENNVLTGTPGIDAENCEITAIANYYHGDTVYKLEKSFYITIAHMDSSDQLNLNSVVSVFVDC